MRQMKGKDLIFVSRIQRNGLAVEVISKKEDVEHCLDETFDVHSLSLTKGTYIAIGFNSYVVRLKLVRPGINR